VGPARPHIRQPQPGLVEGIDALCAELYPAAEHFRPVLNAADPLAAELRAAQLLARFTSESGPLHALDLALGLVALAARHPQPHVAAMTAAVGWLRPGMATSMALADLARHGVRPPPWHERIGEVTPGRAWRYRDVFGDQEAVLASFFYDDVEHAILVETVNCPAPHVRAVHMSTTAAQARAILENSAGEAGEHRVMQEISLAQARAGLEQAVWSQPHRDAEPDSLIFLPVARRRVERLPEPEAVNGVGYTKADRAAAVEEFLATDPLPGTDGGVLRFWAEVLAGYTATNASAPTRIGPVWLGHALEDHVPRIFELTAAQRTGLVPAVTAWAKWAAGKRGLTDAAVDRLTERVTEIDERFDAVYRDPDLVPVRCYLSDIAAVTADGEDLLRAFTLRAQAVPLPLLRPTESRPLLASDPLQRRRILADDAEEWGPQDVSTQDWLDALTRVSDQLWHDNPPEVGQAVLRYLDGDGPEPGLLDDLAELAIEHAGDSAGYLAAIRTRTAPPT
jgi:hypothetical protein